MQRTISASEMKLSQLTPVFDNLTNATAGLDGYWERQAMVAGMRTVVGQRLELGDNLGWNFDGPNSTVTANMDPLYPTQQNGMANKQKQRVTLRDNLAAVQGMVVYHYEGRAAGVDISDFGAYPLACMAKHRSPWYVGIADYKS